MAKARDLSKSAIYDSLKAAGNIFGDTAWKMMAKKPTQSDNFLSLEKDDLIIFPLSLRSGYSKQFGAFVLAYVLKGGDPKSLEIHQIFPGTIKRTLWPVERNDDGEWVRIRDINPKNTGSAVDFANKYGDFASVFKNLQGKGIKVLSSDEHTVLRFGSKDETREARVYELELVDKLDAKYDEFLEKELVNTQG